MATSGNTSFTTTRNQIIRAAALEVRAWGAQETPAAYLVQDFAFALNAMIKHWQGRGLKVWTVSDATLFPQVGQTKYTSGDGATDHITNTFAQSTLSAAEVAAQTVLSVTSTTLIAVSDRIGIVLDSGSIHWSTVSSKTSTTVTIADALASAAALGSAVFSYTSRIAKPIRVVAARTYNVASQTETPLELISMQEYRDLPTKTQTGAINLMKYAILRASGEYYLWNVPNPIDTLVRFTYWRPIETFEGAGDNPDLPEEWVRCLKWNLAYEMMGRFPVSAQQARQIEANAKMSLMDMEGFGREDESIYLQPDMV